MTRYTLRHQAAHRPITWCRLHSERPSTLERTRDIKDDTTRHQQTVSLNLTSRKLIRISTDINLQPIDAKVNTTQNTKRIVNLWNKIKSWIKPAVWWLHEKINHSYHPVWHVGLSSLNAWLENVEKHTTSWNVSSEVTGRQNINGRNYITVFIDNCIFGIFASCFNDIFTFKIEYCCQMRVTDACLKSSINITMYYK